MGWLFKELGWRLEPGITVLQIQVMVRAGLELGTSGTQVGCFDYSATLVHMYLAETEAKQEVMNQISEFLYTNVSSICVWCMPLLKS